MCAFAKVNELKKNLIEKKNIGKFSCFLQNINHSCVPFSIKHLTFVNVCASAANINLTLQCENNGRKNLAFNRHKGWKIKTIGTFVFKFNSIQ